MWCVMESGKMPYKEKIAGFMYQHNTAFVMKWGPQIELPYDSYLSKNRAIRVGRGRLFKDPKHKKAQADAVRIIKSRMKGIKVPTNAKIWIDLYMFKPRKNSDAHNILDGLMDSIEKAIGVNDSHFAIERLDWEVSPKHPKIILTIGYEREVK